MVCDNGGWSDQATSRMDRTLVDTESNIDQLFGGILAMERGKCERSTSMVSFVFDDWIAFGSILAQDVSCICSTVPFSQSSSHFT